VGTSEQVGPISISNFEKKKQRDNLRHQETPSQQEEPTQE